jgi:hypothetical protein
LRRIRNVNVADDFTVPALSEVVLDVYVEIDQIDGLCSALEFLIEPNWSLLRVFKFSISVSSSSNNTG